MNGPQKGEQSSALRFRGEKWSALEGGTRVPCIVSAAKPELAATLTARAKELHAEIKDAPILPTSKP